MFSKEVMIRHHLQHNHYPPIDSVFDEVALEVIEIATDEYFEDREIELPNGVSKFVHEILDELHLWDFVEMEREAI